MLFQAVLTISQEYTICNAKSEIRVMFGNLLVTYGNVYNCGTLTATALREKAHAARIEVKSPVWTVRRSRREYLSCTSIKYALDFAWNN
jgi:hypothetical protein